ncbi:S41 family peptidase [Fulvivirga sedimenti]|uniref:Tricorn protease homolog n=1 Tax=Fulvivirga sedimenti TaxID=2879465 RepID=A0A9X1HNL0_9BACT|nr:S41 family peptidase [Fulvivirga sedimenti]MCA6074305.1 peptidase S41 [Fulvivirga sedimenti]
MKNLFKISLLSLIVILFSPALHAQQSPLYFTLDPTLTPDGSTIIFSYESDLWKVAVNGGEAVRLTAMDGEETRPAVSPDGKWLAFSSTQNGNKDIFVMPLEGGELRQLTYHDANDDVDSWSWDSKSIYFTSNRIGRFSGFRISASGGTPERLFENYFNTTHNLAEHPSSGELFFNESWESKIFAHRKRYKGDYNPDIKSYNPTTEEYKEYTSYNGKDFGVTIDRNGNIYFMSDEANGEYNLYTFNNGTKQALTNFTSSLYWPKVNANGGKIVFRRDYQIQVYDVASGQTTTPVIRIFKNALLEKPQEFKVSSNITAFDVAPDNKKLVFVSRGRMFISDVKGKFVKAMETPSAEAVGEVYWLKDNMTILFSMSDGGYYNWYTLRADGKGEMSKHTNDDQTNRSLSMNSDRTKAAYISGRNEVRVMDLASFTSKTIANDELWGFRNAPPQFSPDDRYVAFNAFRDFETDVFIHDLNSGETFNLTMTRVSEDNPVWSPDGKYIFISSDPMNPGYPYGTQNARIFKIPLKKFTDPFKSDELEELFKEEEKKVEEDNGKNKKDKKDKEEEKKSEEKKVSVEIDRTKIMERMEAISPGFGQQRSPFVIQDKDKLIVLYLSNHDEGKTSLWKTTMEPFESNKTEKIESGPMFGFEIHVADGNYYLLSGGDIHTFKPADGKLDKIEIDFTFRKNLKDEFVQMYYEAWAGMEENFYDETFHGEDWAALRDTYAKYIPYINSRAELRLIFNDMLGELNTSHFGFNSFGKEEDTYFEFQSTSAGLLFRNDQPYVVEHIATDGPADMDGVDIQPGDKLVAVNGRAIDETMNRESYFYLPSQMDEITLTLDRGGRQVTQKLHPVSASLLNGLLYDEWQNTNQAYVDEKGGKRIAYVHMKNMGRGEYNRFVEDMVREGAYRDGLILDLRYNTGGNVHDDVLNFLSRKKYLEWKYREGKKTSQPNFHPADKPIVLLINEQSLSDAEMTAAGFKALGLGTIVGTETYRWIIFTSGKGLVDGSFYRLPSWGCYTLDGKDIEKEGVSPDIRVEENFKDRLKGNQPQLDKAIEIILAELNK